ncbi:MAG: M48 family metallopeptidase [Candidatus Cryptobacteroides sp.]
MPAIDKLFEDKEFGIVRVTRNSRSRRIGLKVRGRSGKYGERISVTVPYLMRYQDGLDFMDRRRDWVRNALQKQDETAGKAAGEGRALISVRDGLPVHTLVADILFRADPGLSGKVTVRGSMEEGRLTRTIRFPAGWLGADGSVSDRVRSEMLKEVLAGVLRKDARPYLATRLAELAERYGFRYRRMTVKHNLSNWGSCSSLGNINLNLNLIRLPKPLGDYVLLHELCHLRERNHGPAFHSILGELCRDNLARLASEGCAEASRYLPLPDPEVALRKAVAGWVIF